MSTEAGTTLKTMRKIGLQYPLKIEMSIKVTHNFSAVISAFLFLILSLISFNDRNRRNSVSELPGLAIEKAKLKTVTHKKLTKAADLKIPLAY